MGHYANECKLPDRRKSNPGDTNSNRSHSPARDQRDQPAAKKQRSENNRNRVAFDDDVTSVNMIRLLDRDFNPNPIKSVALANPKKIKAYGDSGAGKHCWKIEDLPNRTVLEPTTTHVQTVSEGEMIIPMGKTDLGEPFNEVLVFNTGDLRKNLISLSVLDGKGYKIGIQNGKMFIQAPNGSLFMEG